MPALRVCPEPAPPPPVVRPVPRPRGEDEGGREAVLRAELDHAVEDRLVQGKRRAGIAPLNVAEPLHQEEPLPRRPLGVRHRRETAGAEHEAREGEAHPRYFGRDPVDVVAEDHQHDDVGRRVEPDRLERPQHEVGPVAHHAEVVDAPPRLERLQHFGAPLGLLDAHAEHHRVAQHDHAPPSVGLVQLPAAAEAVAVGHDGDEPPVVPGIPRLHRARRPQPVAVRVPALEEIRAIADGRIGNHPQRAPGGGRARRPRATRRGSRRRAGASGARRHVTRMASEPLAW